MRTLRLLVSRMPIQPDATKRAFRRLFGAKKRESAPTPPSPGHSGPSDGLRGLLDQVQATPFNPRPCYELAIALLHQGLDDDGIRYLDRSFRLDPLNIVRFVRTPELKEVRLRPSVVTLLTRLRRDQEQRSYAAYA